MMSFWQSFLPEPQPNHRMTTLDHKSQDSSSPCAHRALLDQIRCAKTIDELELLAADGIRAYAGNRITSRQFLHLDYVIEEQAEKIISEQ
jgi:hypothetical protein